MKKKNSIPKTISQSIPYECVYPNGIIEITPGVFSKSYQIGSINFQTATDAEQWKIAQAYSDFIGSFDKDVSVELTMYNKTIDIDKFKQDVLLPMQDDDLNEFREEYNDMLLEKITSSKNNLQTITILTIILPEQSIKEASEKFLELDNTVCDNMAQLTKTDCPVLTTIERLEILNQIYNPKDDHPLYQKAMIQGHEVESFTLENCAKQGITTKDVIAPSGLCFKDDHFLLGDIIGKVYYVSNFPTWIKGNLLSQFMSISGNMLLSVYFNATSQDKAFKMIKQQTTNIRSGIITRQRQSSTTTDTSIVAPDLSDAMKETDALKESMTHDNARLFTTTLVFTLFAQTDMEMHNLENNLMMIANKNMLTVRPLTYQQEQGFNTSLPLGNKMLTISRLMTTESVASLNPFSVKEVHQKKGRYYGLNAYSKNMILYDRTQGMNPCGCILGMPGAGKSFASKREIIDVLLGTEDAVYILDPEREYKAIADAFDGTVIKISNGSNVHINPFDLNMENSGDDGDPIKVKVNFIETICEIAIGGRFGLSPIERTIIGRCVEILYKDHVRYLQESGKLMDPEKAPTMIDFYNVLKMQPEPEAANIALGLERFATGSYDTFSYRSNININNRLVVYDIKEIGTGLKELGLHIALDNIWNKMIENKENGKRTWVYIDEFYLLMNKETSANYIAEIWKRARKWNGIPTAITQNVEDMLKSDQARTVINNSNFIILLKQSGINQVQLSKLLSLTPEEQKYIATGKSGTGLLKIGSDAIPMNDNFPKNTKLYKIMTTKPDEQFE